MVTYRAVMVSKTCSKEDGVRTSLEECYLFPRFDIAFIFPSFLSFFLSFFPSHLFLSLCFFSFSSSISQLLSLVRLTYYFFSFISFYSLSYSFVLCLRFLFLFFFPCLFSFCLCIFTIFLPHSFQSLFVIVSFFIHSFTLLAFLFLYLFILF
ncbi:unnamed protein product [Acanthosepion pharaonis]|uniref:Uncharacterized protein n=1 Tax=Acanthosepion pharaonis TaxID=158019 RepID=A0A812D555_ACAPH|nr:unnamed protein product [Sepia pharaonis]